MTAKAELRHATHVLDRLTSELSEKRAVLSKLEASTNVDLLARQTIQGGLLHDNDGPLRDLQSLRFRCELLDRAIDLQRDQLAKIEQRVAQEEITAYKKVRDEIVADIYLSCGQLAKLFAKLERIGERAKSRQGDPADFDAESLFSVTQNFERSTDAHRLAAQLARIRATQLVSDKDILPFRQRSRKAA